MSVFDPATAGLRAMGVTPRTHARPAYAPTPSPAPAPAPETGWTAPVTIFTKQEQINASANALSADIEKNVGRQTFKDAWRAWFDNWKAFFDRYQKWTTQMSTVFYSDDLNRQTEEWRSQLLGWYDGYAREKTASGDPLPAPSGQAPVRAPTPPSGGDDGGNEGFHIPWWVWVAGTLGLVGGGYLVYKSVRKVAPLALGPAGMLVARDPGPPMMPMPMYGPPVMPPVPTLSAYAYAAPPATVHLGSPYPHGHR